MKNPALFTSLKQDWATPQKDFDEWDDHYFFTFDPCCTTDNCKCPDGLYWDLGDDGLLLPWSGRVFMNPPYDDQRSWVEKAVQEVECPSVEFVVGLLPARTDTMLFHDLIWDIIKGGPRPGVKVEFLKGRLIFGSDLYWAWVWEQKTINGKENRLYKKYGTKNPAPFPSMLVTWEKVK